MEDAAETHAAASRRRRASPSDSSSASHDVCEAACRQLEIDQQHDRRSRGQRDIELAIDAVFTNHGDRSRVDDVRWRRYRCHADRRRARSRSRPSRNSPVIAIARSSDGTGTSARHKAPGSGAVRNVTLDNHAERAFGSDEEIDEVHARRDEITCRSLRHIRHANVIRQPDDAIAGGRGDRRSRHRPTRCSPRDSSSTSPPASTIVSPSTHSRTVPYLNVAAPAAQVATAPPAKAPRYVGTGGNQRPAFASSSCSACSGTPAPTRTRSPRDADRVETIGAEDDVAERRGAAGQRRLRADRQHAPRLAKARRHFVDRSRPQHAGGAAAGIVRGIFEKSESPPRVTDQAPRRTWRTGGDTRGHTSF